MPINNWFVIGMMSGTSLDGLDLAYVNISKGSNGYTYEILKTTTISYSEHWKNTLKSSFHASQERINEIDKEYGLYLGEKALEFISDFSISKVDLIASHGHTIFHKPNEGYTLQIGDGYSLNKKTGLLVVCDFRTQDVALGGQGAPLVPIGDKLLFTEYDYCLNLGGFANISYESEVGRTAFDICAVNTVLNHYAQKLGRDFDDGGKIAEGGELHAGLLDSLNGLSYYTKPLPKSLGFEFVDGVLFPLIEGFGLDSKTVLRTYSEHVAIQIANCLKSQNHKNILITGGGTFNSFLISQLISKTSLNCIIPDSSLINYKEALIFAFLGVLRIKNEVNCLRSVTGAKNDHSSGKIFS